jgi:hypothetical protein
VYLANVITEPKKDRNIEEMFDIVKTDEEGKTAYESLKPNVAFAWLRVIWREIFDTFL